MYQLIVQFTSMTVMQEIEKIGEEIEITTGFK